MNKKNKLEWKLNKYPIDHFTPNPQNPRVLSEKDFEHLNQSLAKFGLIDKPIVNKDLNVIGGHQRLEILRRNGEKAVECWEPNRQLTKKECDELSIRLNKNTGDWDYDILANQWNGLDLIEWGFDAEQLLGKADKVDEKSAPPKAKKLKTCPSCGHEF